MRTLTGYLLSSLWVGLLAGCQSLSDPTTGTTTVERQVVESGSRQGVAGATVQVYHTAKGGGYAPAAAPVQAETLLYHKAPPVPYQ